jgi:hypothetical protein
MKYIPRAVTDMDDRTVHEVREEVLSKAEAYLDTPGRKKSQVGETCPVCTQLVAVHPRKLYSTMAAALIRLYRYAKGQVGVFIHVNDLKMNRGGDFAKLVLFGLVKAKNKRTKQENAQGLYCLTNNGRLFVLGKLKVPHEIFMYNAQIVLWPSGGKRVDVKDALGKGFDYHALLNGSA